MTFQWSDPNPHYRRISYGSSLGASDRFVVLWGMSNTPIAYCDGEEQAERIKQRLLQFLTQVESEENRVHERS